MERRKTERTRTLDVEVRQRRELWEATARVEQLPPSGDWLYWLVLAGRGFGKTRLAMEDAGFYGMTHPNERIALVAATFEAGVKTMVEGESGLNATIPRSQVDRWNRSSGELFLNNGTKYQVFSSQEPESLRGPQHHRGYADELAAWYQPKTEAGADLENAWDQLLFGMRLGKHPRIVIATTPKPTQLVKRVLNNPRTVVTRGSTYDNAANLSAVTLSELKTKYENTRLGRQELLAEMLDDVPGALWTREMIDEARKARTIPDMARIVVAVDPSGARDENDDAADSQGIVVAGLGVDGRCYILHDKSCKLSPGGWGKRVIDAYHDNKADRVVAERNFGGAMVQHVIRSADPKVPFRELTASRSKMARAEPVAALYEQKKITHVGELAALEDQMCQLTSTEYLGKGSPDRLDALVWAVTDLMLTGAQRVPYVMPYSVSAPRGIPG